MFDLEQSIADWRKQMLTGGIQTPVPLEELELHLREEIERQMQSGFSNQKAFEIAIRTIGQASALKSEFGKIKNTNTKILSIILSVIAAVMGSLFLGFAVWMHFAMQYVAVKVSGSAPAAADAFVDERYFYWPLFAAGIFMTLACAGFLSLYLSTLRRREKKEAV